MSNPSQASIPAVIRAVFERIGPSLELVEGAMREQLSSEAELVVGLGEHVLSSGGKRIRPALLILAAELCALDALRVGEPKYSPFSWRDYIRGRITDNYSDIGEDDIQISRYKIA